MDCADIPRIVAQSSDPNFAQDNPRIVPIRSLRITDILHDVTIMDGATVVIFFKPLAAKTFDNYAQNVCAIRKRSAAKCQSSGHCLGLVL